MNTKLIGEPSEDMAFGPYSRLSDRQIDLILAGEWAVPFAKSRAKPRTAKGTRCSLCGQIGHTRQNCR